MAVAAGHANERGSNQGPVLVRRAVPRDARAIAEINVAGWQAAYRGLMPADFLANLSIDAREMAWQSLLEGNEDCRSPAWIAESGGRPIGYIVTGPPRDEDVSAPAAEIYAIYVRPERWRTGTGRALMNAAMAESAARGARTLVLWVLEGNVPARAFYDAMGWRPDGGRQEIDMGGFKAIEIRYRRSET